MKVKYEVVCTRGEVRDFTVYEGENQGAATSFVHNLLLSVKRFHLLSALNDIQLHCGGATKDSPFFDKFKIPLIVVNLVLKEHGLKIEERTVGGK